MGNSTSFKMEGGKDNWVRGCVFGNGVMMDKSGGKLEDWK
jgi:hypothetical protein